jgi:hypothetical protein
MIVGRIHKYKQQLLKIDSRTFAETGLNSAQSNPTCASSEVPVRNSVKMKSLKQNNEPVYWTELTSLGYNPDSR